VKAGRFVLKPPELAAMLNRQWSSRPTSIIGFPASPQSPGFLGPGNPTITPPDAEGNQWIPNQKRRKIGGKNINARKFFYHPFSYLIAQ